MGWNGQVLRSLKIYKFNVFNNKEPICGCGGMVELAGPC